MPGLYKSQKEAMNKLHTGSVLCGGVGTGKSRTALAYFTLKECGGYSTFDGEHSCLRRPKPLYVITTARKRDGLEWEHEAAPFLISCSEFSIVDFTVDSWNNIEKYASVKGAFFIFDEQRIVGRGKWSKMFIKIAANNDWIMLSATPGDVWLDYATLFIANGYFKNITQFYNEHCVFSRFVKYPKIDRYVGTRKLERYRSEILVTMEFEKEATRHEEWVKIGYDEAFYDQFYKERWNAYEQKPIINASQFCYLCRRVVNENDLRIEALSNILDRKRKAVIFYNFDYELVMILDFLDMTGYPYSQWNGHKHEMLPEGDRWAYVVQYSAGAEGWNCVTTDTVIFFSLNYSYRIVEQAQGRIDRLNTPYKDLWYYFLFTDAPIDQSIKHCLKRKKNFNEKAFTAKEIGEWT